MDGRTATTGARATWAACSGCGLCVLACPVWNETRDVMMTPHGRCKSMQGGAAAADLADSILACVMCGACEAVCPESIDTLALTRRARGELAEAGLSPLACCRADAAEAVDASLGTDSKRILLAGALSGHPELLAAITARLGGDGDVVAGPDLIAASRCHDAGLPDAARLMDQALARMPNATHFIVADGAMISMLRERVPQATVIGLGESLLRLDSVRHGLSPTDFYVLEPRAYHADQARLAPFYEQLRQETGCRFSLDLQRLAISTGRGLQDDLGLENLDWRAQIRWMLQGRTFLRVIVEDARDLAPLAETTDAPVIHVGALPS